MALGPCVQARSDRHLGVLAADHAGHQRVWGLLSAKPQAPVSSRQQHAPHCSTPGRRTVSGAGQTRLADPDLTSWASLPARYFPHTDRAAPSRGTCPRSSHARRDRSALTGQNPPRPRPEVPRIRPIITLRRCCHPKMSPNLAARGPYLATCGIAGPGRVALPLRQRRDIL